ncbi:MAG: hypothetical protein JXQ75_22930 [Phycisphaerae bacterium]|nr:hypothetical protein [Phycisphaerae bacterium]
MRRNLGGGLVLDVLQRFSASNLTGLLSSALLFWLIWPVLCGLLGAKRGQGLQGVMHGLFWGPLGLPVVLLSSRKYVCPTCGKRTLAQPGEARRVPAMAPAAVPTSSEPSVRQSGLQARDSAISPIVEDVEAPPVLQQPPASGPAEPLCEQVPESRCADHSDDEADRLYAWINDNRVDTASAGLQ